MKSKLVTSLKSFLLVLGITTIFSEASVSAVTLNIGDKGKTFEVEWLRPTEVKDDETGEILDINLSAEANFTVDKFYRTPEEGDHLVLDVTLANTTELNGMDNAGISKFGFAAASNITSIGLLDSKNDNTDTDRFVGVSPEGGFKDIDACIYTNENIDGGCPGNQDTALAAGEFDNFSLDIYGDFTDGVSFSKFPLNFQIDENRYAFDGREVPEPGMVIALGLFTAGSIVLKRKSR